MALSTHEIWLVLRARDEATRVLQRTANSLQSEQLRIMRDQLNAAKDNKRAYQDLYRSNVQGIQSQIKEQQRALATLGEEKSAAKSLHTQNMSQSGQRLATLKEEGRIRALAHQNSLDQSKARILQFQNQAAQHKQSMSVQIAEVRRGMDAERLAFREYDRGHRAKIMAIENTRRVAAKAHTLDMADFDSQIQSQRNVITEMGRKKDMIGQVHAEGLKAHDANIAQAKAGLAAEMDLIQKQNERIHGLQTMGATLIQVGVVGAIAFGSMSAALWEMGSKSNAFEQSIAQIMTQANTMINGEKDIRTEAYQVREAIMAIGKDTPVPLSNVSAALYDIYSSMDVGREGAEKILKTISKFAVGGAADIDTSGRAIIQVLNGFKLGAEDSTRVGDTFLAMVRDGVGTTDDFVNAIGRSIPSAFKAGASFEDMAGALALLTRNGLSTQMASTSLGRAFDLISNPKFEQNMRKKGLTVKDAHGNFLPLTDIVGQLKGKMDGLNETDRAKFLKDITGGAGGTIQAMRALLGMTLSTTDALDAVSDPKFREGFNSMGMAMEFTGNKAKDLENVQNSLKDALAGMSETQANEFLYQMTEATGVSTNDLRTMAGQVVESNGNLQDLTATMYNAGGTMEDMYSQMADTPEAKLQLLANAWDTIGWNIGLATEPLRMFIVDGIAGLMNAFNSLDPSVQSFIANALIIGTIVGFVASVVAVLVGGFMLLQAVFAASSAAFIAGAVAVGWITLAIVAVIAIVLLLIYYWDEIVAVSQATWSAVVAFLQPAIDKFNELAAPINEIWQRVLPALMEWFGKLNERWTEVVTFIMAFLQPAIDNLKEAMSGLGPVLEVIGSAFANVWGAITVILQVVIAILGVLWNAFVTAFQFVAGMAGVFVSGLINLFSGLIKFFTGLFTGDWGKMWDGVVDILTGIGQMIVGLIGGLVAGVIGFFVGMVDGVINAAKYLWDVLVGHSIIPDMVNGILDWIGKLPGRVIGFFTNMVQGAIQWAVNMYTNVKAEVEAMVSAVVSFLAGLPSRAIGAISSLAGQMLSKAKEWMDNMKRGVENGWNAVNSFFGGIPGRILGALGNLGGLLVGAGRTILDGFLSGLRNGFNAVKNFVGGIASWIANNKGPLDYDYKLLQPAGKAIMGGLAFSFDDNMPLLEGAINRVTNAIAIDPNGINTNLGSSYYPAYNGNDNLDDRPININVHTEEIDPVKHAADLGYELSTRLGSI